MPGSAWHCLPKRPGHVEDDADDRPGKAGAFPAQITVVSDTNPDDDGQSDKGKDHKSCKRSESGLMVDDITDIQGKEQNIIFIHHVENANVRIRFLAVKDLTEDAASPNAQTVTENIKEELAKNDLQFQKILSLASDGA